MKFKPEVEKFIVDQLNKALSGFDTGKAALEKGSQILVNLLDEHGGVWLLAAKHLKPSEQQRLTIMEKIGRGELLIDVALGMTVAAARLAKMPVTAQRALLTKPVKVVQFVDGKHCVVEKPVLDLSITELKQVFTPDQQLRDPDAQVAALTATKSTRLYVSEKRDTQRFQISEDGNSIKFFADTVFTFSQLIEFMDRMAATNTLGMAQTHAPSHKRAAAAA